MHSTYFRQTRWIFINLAIIKTNMNCSIRNPDVYLAYRKKINCQKHVNFHSRISFDYSLWAKTKWNKDVVTSILKVGFQSVRFHPLISHITLRLPLDSKIWYKTRNMCIFAMHARIFVTRPEVISRQINII